MPTGWPYSIAILAWGSLIYDRGCLAIQGDWQTGGPILPVEFSRISQTGERKGCLTLVIDEVNGANVPSCFAISAKIDLKEAIANLKERERMPNTRDIGFLDLKQGTMSLGAFQHHPKTCAVIHSWARQQVIDAVLWTALPSNFQQVTNKGFTVEAAIEYLSNLSPSVAVKAGDYINRTPTEIMTPLRRELDTP